ncbi:helix-turn-helix domain-containing protein [Streptantibioticus parmotrematis]|uniref:helix-turn-helix domain-containing protein n=1 Tax=Streptantibioticus parmotrematis TaxID=2873249 RepID=UPI0027E052FF|nr:transcriptional regulator [Streptantibioticus parmotrematis]
MVLLRLDSLALSRSRFALSPLAETMGAVITLTRPSADPWLTPWRDRHRPAFRAVLDADPFAAGLVGLVGATKYVPGHITLPPTGGMRTRIEDELARMAAVSDEVIGQDMRRAVEASWEPRERHDLARWFTGRNWGARTAELFRHVWDAYVAEDWPRRRAALERDVTYRAGLLAAYGWPRALDRMSRHSAWVGADAIRFSSRPGHDRVVGPDGMLFVPYTSSRGGTWLCSAPGEPYALVYPARGTGEAAVTPEPGVRERALARLLGAGRAAILRSLERPATSSELAAELGVSLGTVGGHLAVLRDADLVAGTRVGRRVVYRRTETGEALARGTAPSGGGGAVPPPPDR